MKLYRVDVSGYSNNAIRKEDGRFYMAHEVEAEIDALKAENARLRADAERYRWLRDPKTDIALVIDKVVDEIPSEEGTGYDGLKVYEYRCGEELDTAIDAAMKDFSTNQKEEECDS